MLLILCALSLISTVAHSCQPAPTTTTQIRAIAADPPADAPRLVSIEQLQGPPAPVQSIFDLLKFPTLPPMPTIPTIVPPMDSVANVSDLETELNSTLASDLISANLTAEELRTDMRNSSTTDDGDLAKELIAAEKSVQSSFSSTTMATLKLFAVPQKDAMNPVCEHATITAITLMPYEDTLIGMDLDRLHQQIKLYEAYTQRKLSSFGEYSEEATNIDGNFALRFNIKSTQNCNELREYLTQSVSYSREIERIKFECHCEPTWIIAKRRSG